MSERSSSTAWSVKKLQNLLTALLLLLSLAIVVIYVSFSDDPHVALVLDVLQRFVAPISIATVAEERKSSVPISIAAAAADEPQSEAEPNTTMAPYAPVSSTTVTKEPRSKAMLGDNASLQTGFKETKEEVLSCSPWKFGLSDKKLHATAGTPIEQARPHCKCEDQAKISCASCWLVGNQKLGAMHVSNLVRVTNVVYKDGVPLLLTRTGNDSDASVRSCFPDCVVAMTLVSLRFSRTVALDGLKKQSRTEQEVPRYGREVHQGEARRLCGAAPSSWKRHLLVIDRWGGTSFYHFLIDTLFPTWATRTMLALQYNISVRDVDIAILSDGEYDGFHTLPQFDVMWKAEFGSVTYVQNLTIACYASVVYGFYFNLRPTKFPARFRMLHDGVAGLWLRSFRITVQRSWGTSHCAFNASAHWLYMEHRRMPAWLATMPWWRNASVAFRKRNQTKYSIAEQIAAVSRSGGLASVEGAAFAHQLFLPPTAYLLIFHPRRSECLPELWHTSVAQYLQLVVLDWRICPARYTVQDVHRVIDYFLYATVRPRKQKHSWSCTLFDVPDNFSADDNCRTDVDPWKTPLKVNVTWESSEDACWDFGFLKPS